MNTDMNAEIKKSNAQVAGEAARLATHEMLQVLRDSGVAEDKIQEIYQHAQETVELEPS
jgi:hypothetical protein